MAVGVAEHPTFALVTLECSSCTHSQLTAVRYTRACTQADFAQLCPAATLHWNYRKRNLLREMLAYKADILCLQEVGRAGCSEGHPILLRTHALMHSSTPFTSSPALLHSGQLCDRYLLWHAQVQSDHYNEFWAPELQKAGYVAIYKKKTTEIFTDNK